MPRVSRPLTNWQAAGNSTAAPMPGLSRSWPRELPAPQVVRDSVPGAVASGTRRGRPVLGRESGASTTGGPAMGQARSAIFMTPTF